MIPLLEKKAVLGIDPGLKGGVAIMCLGTNGEPDKVITQVMPIKPGAKGGNDVDARALSKIIADLTETGFFVVAVAVELVHAMKAQGVVSVFNFGKGYGKVLGVLEAEELPIVNVTPQAWKKVVLDGLGREKSDAIRFVLDRFPKVELKATKRSTTYHDGIADAVCLAEFARRQYLGKTPDGKKMPRAKKVKEAPATFLTSPPRVYRAEDEWRLDYLSKSGATNTLKLDSDQLDEALAEAAAFLKVPITSLITNLR